MSVEREYEPVAGLAFVRRVELSAARARVAGGRAVTSAREARSMSVEREYDPVAGLASCSAGRIERERRHRPRGRRAVGARGAGTRVGPARGARCL